MTRWTRDSEAYRSLEGSAEDSLSCLDIDRYFSTLIDDAATTVYFQLKTRVRSACRQLLTGDADVCPACQPPADCPLPCKLEDPTPMIFDSIEDQRRYLTACVNRTRRRKDPADARRLRPEVADDQLDRFASDVNGGGDRASALIGAVDDVGSLIAITKALIEFRSRQRPDDDRRTLNQPHPSLGQTPGGPVRRSGPNRSRGRAGPERKFAKVERSRAMLDEFLTSVLAFFETAGEVVDTYETVESNLNQADRTQRSRARRDAAWLLFAAAHQIDATAEEPTSGRAVAFAKALVRSKLLVDCWDEPSPPEL